MHFPVLFGVFDYNSLFQCVFNTVITYFFIYTILITLYTRGNPDVIFSQ